MATTRARAWWLFLAALSMGQVGCSSTDAALAALLLSTGWLVEMGPWALADADAEIKASVSPATYNCSVKHCLQCDPVLSDECLQCEPPKLRLEGSCHDTCSKGYFPVRNSTDTPFDYPHCQRDCHTLSVSGIPAGPDPFPAASSTKYNTHYQIMTPSNQSDPNFRPSFVNLELGAYLATNEDGAWRFVGLPSVCPNGTEKCNPLTKLAIGGATSGPPLVRPQLCDQISSCTWMMWQCNCSSLEQPCRCEREQWAQVPVASLNFRCTATPAPVVIFPSPAPAPKSKPTPPAPSTGPPTPPTTFIIPLVAVCSILAVGVGASLIALSRRHRKAEDTDGEDGNNSVRKDDGASTGKGGALREVAGSSYFGSYESSSLDFDGLAGQKRMLQEALLSDQSTADVGDVDVTRRRASSSSTNSASSRNNGFSADVKPEWQIPYERLKIDPRAKIGSGGFGIVYKGKFDGIDVAVKRLERTHISSKLSREAAVLARLRHPHVVQLYGLSQDDYSVYIVMELCRMSLSSLMERDGVSPSKAMRLRIALQISDTMSYLHMKGVIHRDLKPENILLHGSAYDVKICDFGLSKLIHNGTVDGGEPSSGPRSTSNITLEIGTPAYMAPEMFVTDEINPGPVQSRSVDGRKVDVYSFGIMLFYLYTCEVRRK